MMDTPSGVSGNGGNLIKGTDISGGIDPWGGTTVAVSSDIWISVVIVSIRLCGGGGEHCLLIKNAEKMIEDLR